MSAPITIYRPTSCSGFGAAANHVPQRPAVGCCLILGLEPMSDAPKESAHAQRRKSFLSVCEDSTACIAQPQVTCKPSPSGRACSTAQPVQRSSRAAGRRVPLTAQPCTTAAVRRATAHAAAASTAGSFPMPLADAQRIVQVSNGPWAPCTFSAPAVHRIQHPQ